MNVGEAFAEFKSRLEITKTEEDRASRRHQAIRDHLRSRLESDTDFLTGSYARHTKTKPLRDVDIFFVLEKNDENTKRFEDPEAGLKYLQEILEEKYEDSTDLGRRSVTVHFGGEEVESYDVVPAFNRDGGGYEIPDRHREEWIGTDPTVHADLATAANKTMNGNWKPLIKMIKAWNRNLGEDRIRPSFVLEVMGLEIAAAPPFGDYAYEVQRFFGNAAEVITRSWPDPAGLGPPVNDGMTDIDRQEAVLKLERAYGIAHEARRLERDVSVDDAIRLWRELMGRLMPAPS